MRLSLKQKKFADNPKVLILTNKAIAEKNGFQQLYKVFDDRYADVKDRIEKYLCSIQALDVADLCNLFLIKDYNLLIQLVCRWFTIYERIHHFYKSMSIFFFFINTTIKLF